MLGPRLRQGMMSMALALSGCAAGGGGAPPPEGDAVSTTASTPRPVGPSRATEEPTPPPATSGDSPGTAVAPEASPTVPPSAPTPQGRPAPRSPRLRVTALPGGPAGGPVPLAFDVLTELGPGGAPDPAGMGFDPVLRIGASRLTDYRIPAPGRLRFVVADPDVLDPAAPVVLERGDGEGAPDVVVLARRVGEVLP